MKKMIAALMTVMAFAQASSALGVKSGNYTGATDDGKQCTLSLNVDGDTMTAGLYWPGATGGGIRFNVKKSSLDGNVLKVSGGADFASAKAKILLANDGTPVQAFMGIGMLVQIGYDIECKNLARTAN